MLSLARPLLEQPISVVPIKREEAEVFIFQFLSSTSLRVYSFSMANLINHHSFSGLKQDNLQFCRSEVQNSSQWGKNKMSTWLPSLLQVPENISFHFLLFSSSQGLPGLRVHFHLQKQQCWAKSFSCCYLSGSLSPASLFHL